MVKEILMSTTQENIEDKSFRIRRGKVDSVDLFEVKENELEILANGEEVGIYLNFSIFLLSLAFSGILTLSTATFSSNIIQNAFLFVTLIGLIVGLFLIILWWRGRKSIKTVIAVIKNRIPPDLVTTTTTTTTPIKKTKEVAKGTSEEEEIITPEG